MKKCPKCAEQVQDEALVCRYCGYKLSAYDRFDHGLRNMGFGTAVLIFIGIAVATTKCGNEKPQTPTDADKFIEREVREEDAVKTRLRDPDSAEFKHFKSGCGVVNAKNGFGGMEGPQRYVFDATMGAVFLESDKGPIKFDDMWKARCS